MSLTEPHTVHSVIGASLSKPHTSMTALHTCVYAYIAICSFGPTTYRNFEASVFKHFMPHAAESKSEGLLTITISNAVK